MEVKVIDTKRGKPAILYSGYRFSIKCINKNETIRWICTNRSCPGALLTTNNFKVLQEKNHTCVPNEAKNDVDLCLHKAKKRAREELLPIPKIYREELMQVKDAGLDFVVEVPTLTSVKDRFYRARQKTLGVKCLPKKREEIIIPEPMQHLVLIDDGQEDRILVFSSDRGLLSQGSEFFMDGTFKSCCSLFDQLYTIHVDLGSSDVSTRIVPAIYALLPDRKEATYRRLFTLLEKSSKFKPEKVHIDFERAAINALKQTFLEVKIKGCNFHFNQCLWRKVQELGLVTSYKENSTIREHVRMCAALAHLPKEYIPEAWLLIMENSPQEDALVKFSDYFVEQWLQDSDFIWVCYKERHRTTNSVEGWHHRLNNRVGKAHPNIYELLKILSDEIQYYDIVVKQTELNMYTPKRAKKYCDLDYRINMTVDDFVQTKVSLGETLRKLMYIIKFE